MVASRYHHIAVEGAIGVGKTTLVRAMAARIGAETVLERIDDNPFIALYYENPERHALAVQLSFLFSRYRQYRALQQQELFHRGVITDYIFAKDRLFASVTLSDPEFKLYQEVARALPVDVPHPDLVIYLQSTPEVIMQRIRRRGREFERVLSTEYLQRIIEAYDRFFFHYRDSPLLVVQTDKLNFADSPEDIDALIRRIGAMRSRTEFWADYT